MRTVLEVIVYVELAAVALLVWLLWRNKWEH